jgi:protein-disulfide isomerase
LLVVSLVSASTLAAQTKKPQAADGGVLAMIGDTPVTEAQVDEIARERLARLRAEEYSIRKQALEEFITKALVEKEAVARGVSPEELTRREIEGKVTPVTEDQKRAVYESMPQAFAGKSEAEAFAQIEQNLRTVRLSDARRRFYSGLREKAGVRILLEPPRVTVDASTDPAQGPRDAPVTIIEFADFQCPACRGASQTMRRLQERYAGKLRVVFRDFPLAMHKQAPKAAEAGECANEQGKFWEMHDKLFENQNALQVADLKQRAAELGLDGGRFTACLDSGKYATEWQQDMNDGRRYGVSATPTFFINGRLVQGGRPESLTEIIEEELARTAPAAAGVRR